MSFMEILKESKQESKQEVITEVIETESKLKESMDAESILRNEHFKIKSVHGTKFGTEYIMAKKYDEEDIKKVLKDFTLKFDGKSIFVIS